MAREETDPVKDHLADWTAAAAVITGAMAAFFLWQRRKILANLAEYGVPEMVYEGVREIEQATALRNRLRAPLEEVVEATIVKEATRMRSVSVRKPIRAGETSLKFYRRIKKSGYKPPEAIAQRASGVASEILEGTYWQDTAMAAFEKAEQEFQAALKELANKNRAVTHTKKKLAKVEKSRAVAIGGTEANGSINGGKQIIADIRHTMGEDDSKTWLSMADERVRHTHWAVHNVVVARTQMFTVGGYLTPHPGWWQLPIQERIHCRCFVLIGGGASDIDYPLADDLRETI